jgi:hypothetical protein
MEDQKHKFTIYIPLTENSRGMKAKENNISAKPRTSQAKKIYSIQRAQKFDLSQSIEIDKKISRENRKVVRKRKRRQKGISPKIQNVNRKSKRWKKRIRSS